MAALLGISQKCHYALRALFEIALHYRSKSVVTVMEIAGEQSIPLRFLEQILSKIKAGGYIKSRRGKQGGYIMAVDPSRITVGEIICFLEGTDKSIDCLRNSGSKCTYNDECVFIDLWQRAKMALTDIFDKTTFQDLVDKRLADENHFDYSI